MALEDDLAIFSKLDDRRLAEIAYPVAASLTQDGLYSGTKLEKLSALVRDLRSSGAAAWRDTFVVLNDDAVRGDIALALVLIPTINRALGLADNASVEVIALALLMARLGKH